MLELQTALYHELLDGVPSCSDCPEAAIRNPLLRRRCRQPYGLNRDGMAVARAHGPDLVVSWPGCPRRWERLRRLGGDVVTLATAVRSAIDLDRHKVRHAPAHAGRLFRHYLMSKDAPEGLKAAREREQRRLEALARGAAR